MAEAESRAWELHLAGVPPEQISDVTGLPVVEVIEVIQRKAPTATDGEGAEVELARLSKLWRAVYPEALKGEPKAQNLFMRLSARRTELHQMAGRARGSNGDEQDAGNPYAADQRTALNAIREKLAARLATTNSARDIAALAGRLTDVLARISELDAAAPQPGSAVDEITERRRRRRPVRDGVKREA